LYKSNKLKDYSDVHRIIYFQYIRDILFFYNYLVFKLLIAWSNGLKCLIRYYMAAYVAHMISALPTMLYI